MTRGIHTSEFWLAIVSIVCLTVLVGLDKVTVEIAASIILSSGVYTVARGIRKSSGVDRSARSHRPPPSTGQASALVLAGMLLGGAILLSPGCATGPAVGGDQDQVIMSTRRVEAIAQLAAYVTITADLRAHPEHRPALEAAQRALETLVEDEEWDLQAAGRALLAAGIPELSGTEGQVAVVGGLMLCDALGIASFDVRESEHARALVVGLEQGVRMAMQGPATRGNMDGHRGVLSDLRAIAEATRTLPPLRGPNRLPSYPY